MRAALVAALVLLSLAGGARATAPAGPGEQLFKADCSSCHTIGRGDSVGPDLKGIVAANGAAKVKAFVANPDKELASGDPRIAALVKKFHNVKMPNFHLTPAQVDSLVSYLQAQGGGSSTGSPAAPAVQGHAGAGKSLFTGAAALANGGPACISCHAIAGAGALGGGRLGPDLTKAWTKYGGAKGIASVLAGLPFPRMGPVFKGHPISQQDRADLAAFLEQASAKTAPGRSSTWVPAGLGFGVAGVFLALAFAIWPRRRLVVRRTIAPPPWRSH